MPINVSQQVQWTQNSQSIQLTIPLKGIPPKKVDVYVTDVFCKLNFAPFLCELDLWAPVDPDQSKVTLGNGLAQLELRKIKEEIWPELRFQSESKEELMRRRQEAQQRLEAAQKKKVEDRRTAKYEEEQLMIRKLLEAEQEEREKIERLKQEERNNAQADLKDWQENQLPVSQQKCSEEPAPSQNSNGQWKQIFANKSANTSSEKATKAANYHGRELPPPRAPVRIVVSFTPCGDLPLRTPAPMDDETGPVVPSSSSTTDSNQLPVN